MQCVLSGAHTDSKEALQDRRGGHCSVYRHLGSHSLACLVQGFAVRVACVRNSSLTCVVQGFRSEDLVAHHLSTDRVFGRHLTKIVPT